MSKKKRKKNKVKYDSGRYEFNDGRIRKYREEYSYMSSGRQPEDFDPRNLSQAHLDKLANILSEFISFMDSCVIIPEDLKDKESDYKEGIKRTKKLIEILYAGGIDEVFKDPEEWNFLS